MDQAELTGLFSARPQNFAWFLGAGTSRSAGLPTASDILWDLKRKYYCGHENQDIARQDIQNDAVRDKIQAYMDSQGFPAQWADDEYPAYFEKIFGDDKERQRRYIKDVLAEDRVSLNVGHRVLGALLASNLTRIVFTTNFDSVVEKAVAEVSGRSLSAYHLEGAHNANDALNNEEYPVYCKLHGDFRYDSLKNLPGDLAAQNAALSDCLVNAGNRFGFIVAGYSGRDESIMALFRAVLDSPNPFPHGLYWTGLKGGRPLPAVEDLLARARNRGVSAEYVPIETFDSLLLRFWRNVEDKSPELDATVRKSQIARAAIPLPASGRTPPLLRFNALPVLGVPGTCLALSFMTPKEWGDLRQVRHDTQGRLILTKSDSVLCWGEPEEVRQAFGDALTSIDPRELPADLGAPDNLTIKGFVEEALCHALARGKPLLSRTSRSGAVLIADAHAQAQGALEPMVELVGKPYGTIDGLFSPVTDEHPQPQRVDWAEAVRVSLDHKDGKLWLLLDPDIWVWPPHARRVATDFLDARRKDRRNDKFNALLDAWVRIVLGTDERATEVSVSLLDKGGEPENPAFTIGSRTAFAWGLAS